MKRILSLFFLSSTALLAMDGDEKDLTTKPKIHFSDSIEDSINEFVKSEDFKLMQADIIKRAAAARKKISDSEFNTRTMLSDIRKHKIAFQLHDEDALNRLIASTAGLTVTKILKRPQASCWPRFGGGK